jgi:hypothetical protein
MKRERKTRLRRDMLRSSGFNTMGLTLDASVAVYKTFVRPMVEYGLALTPKTILKPIQRAQEHGLRTMFSSTRHTSRAAENAENETKQSKAKQNKAAETRETPSF